MSAPAGDSLLRSVEQLRRYSMKFFSKPLLEELHRGLLGREPESQSITKWVSETREGKSLYEIVREMHASATVEELYHGILNRAPDANGKDHWARALREGTALRQVLTKILSSEEFQGLRGRSIKQSELPDIRSALPRPYVTQEGLDGLTHHVLHVEQDSEFNLLEHLITEHRFYDSYGGWGYTIDLDKRVTAAMAKGLGAKSCLDIGCSNGPVISLLAKDGVDVAGIDLSHLAFALAYPSIRNRMVYGDLLSVSLERTFDVVIAMDVFEHTNPLKLGEYIS